MIGVPSNNNDCTQFVSLLNPKLTPGSLVQLISENATLNGFYTLRRSHYEGDSHDSKWQVTCEGRPQGSIVQNLPAAKKLIADGDAKNDSKVNPAELAAYTIVASTILNLDETLTKE